MSIHSVSGNKIKYCLLIIPLFLILFTKAYGGENPTSIVLNDSTGRYSLGEHIEYLEDETGELDFETIRQERALKKAGKAWSKSEKEFPSFGFTSSVYWFKFSLRNESKETRDWSLVIDYPLLDSITLYTMDENGRYIRKTAGDHAPFDDREVSYRNFVFHIKPSQINGKVCYLRIQTSSSMNLPLWIMTPVELSRKISNEQFLLGLYYGLMLVIALYNLFIFFAIRDKNYLYYIFWIIGYGMYQVTLNGLSFQYFWPNAIWWANNSLPFFIFFGSTFCVQFGRSFLKTSEQMPRMDKILIAFMIFTITGSLLSFFLPYSVVIKIGTLSVILFTTILLALGIISLINGFRAARYYVVAWITLLLGIIVYALKSLGVLPVNFITSWSQQIGSAMEVTLLSLALADRISLIKQEKRDAELETIKAQQRYRLLFEGSQDILFTLDSNFNFLTVNKAIKEYLKITPEQVISTNFLDLIYVGYDEEAITKKLVQEKLELFSKELKPIMFKTQFTLSVASEPKEMQVWLESINIDGRNEVLGKAASIQEDILMKYFDCEKQRFTIENYLSTAEDISYRTTRNLHKFMDERQVTLLRIALREIIINAIEHGNLNITYHDKTNALINDEYFDIVSSRQKDPDYKHRKVEIYYTVDSEKVRFRVTDEGNGFEYRKILEGNCEDANEEMLDHGRGISMAKNIFDRIEYNRKGNQVLLTKYLCSTPEPVDKQQQDNKDIN